MIDLYEELGLSSGTDLTEIQKILTKQRRDWERFSIAMPDEANEKFAQLDEADKAFATEETKAQYDKELAESKAPAEGQDIDAEREANYAKYFAAAKEYYDNKEYDMAEQAINMALQNLSQSATDPSPFLLASRIYFELNKFDQSLDNINKAILYDSGNASLYVEKYIVALNLGENDDKDRRGMTDQLINILRTAIKKSENAKDNKSLAQASSYLAKLLFTRERNEENTAEAERLARTAVGIDKSLEGANYVLDILAREEEERRRQEEERRRQEEEEHLLKVLTDELNAGHSEMKWIALTIDDDNRKALVITKDCVRKMPYHEKSENITWEHCSLRRWLNSVFLDSLPADVKKRVIESKIINADNPEYSTAGGNNTVDKVFLLSIDEARSYFKDDASRISKFQGGQAWWWLRSPGTYSYLAAYVSHWRQPPHARPRCLRCGGWSASRFMVKSEIVNLLILFRRRRN
jgi:tetratricopeptide (TPR) repeat protein